MKEKTQNQKQPKNDQISGIFLLDKPFGLSSNQALQKVKRLLNVKKAGHAGSLDPMATGMLPICINQATKFSQHFLDSDKTYRAILMFGKETDTGDKEGRVISESEVPNLNLEKLDELVSEFRGEIKQIPPMYSALKQQGKPLYKLAREGIEVERKPRDIIIHQLVLENYDHKTHQLSFEVKCSKGTYIRSLAEDIGKKIGCGAHLTYLRRLACGKFDQKLELITLEQLDALPLEKKYTKLVNIDYAFDHWENCHLTEEELFELNRSGRWISEKQHLDGQYCFRTNGQFIGIGQFDNDQLIWRKFLTI